MNRRSSGQGLSETEMLSASSSPESTDSGVPASLSARLQQKLVSALQTRGLGALVVGLVRRLLRVLLIGYSIGLLLLWLALSQVGENNLTSAFLLYLPPSLWFLPVPFLILPALFLDRKGALMIAGLAAFLLLHWIQYRPFGPKWPSQAPANSLTVLSYNRGQQGSQSLQPFKNATQPDLMVLQDAGNRAEGYLNSPGYSEFQDSRSVGEHTLVSKFPILDAAVLNEPHPGARAARFVIDWNGSQIAIYSVHLKTPRSVLQSQYRGGFLYGILGLPGTPWAAQREERQQFWNGQLEDARGLLDAVKADDLPCIIAGDFNAPHLGALYRTLTTDWLDAHAEAGQGFGFTFPGTTRNPLSGGGPWIRIDYIFAAAGWRMDACRTEPDRTSQHRALAARLLRDPSAKPSPPSPPRINAAQTP